MQFVIDLISRASQSRHTHSMSYSDAVNYILQVIVDVIVYGECVCVWWVCVWVWVCVCDKAVSVQCCLCVWWVCVWCVSVVYGECVISTGELCCKMIPIAVHSFSVSVVQCDCMCVWFSYCTHVHTLPLWHSKALFKLCCEPCTFSCSTMVWSHWLLFSLTGSEFLNLWQQYSVTTIYYCQENVSMYWSHMAQQVHILHTVVHLDNYMVNYSIRQYTLTHHCRIASPNLLVRCSSYNWHYIDAKWVCVHSVQCCWVLTACAVSFYSCVVFLQNAQKFTRLATKQQWPHSSAADWLITTAVLR